MILSVLICTLPSRLVSAFGLIRSLEEQARGKDVQVLYLGDNKSMSVGEKRNRLLEMARGEYVCFVDDDDRVSPRYVSGILEATRDGADCVVFDVEISENGGPYKRVVYSKDFAKDANFSDHYERWPNHLMPIRRGLIGEIRFPSVSAGEDFFYAKKLHELIKTQTRVNETLYYYDYNLNLSETPR